MAELEEIFVKHPEFVRLVKSFQDKTSPLFVVLAYPKLYRGDNACKGDNFVDVHIQALEVVKPYVAKKGEIYMSKDQLAHIADILTRLKSELMADIGALDNQFTNANGTFKTASEMADVLAYLLSLANVLQIDLADALHRKMGKNRQKYPADRFRGTWKKVRS